MISFSQKWFFNLILTSMTLKFEDTDELFYRMFLNLVLSYIFSWLDLHYALLARIIDNWCVFSLDSVHRFRLPYYCAMDFDLALTVMSLAFCIVKSFLLFFVIMHIVERCFGITHYSSNSQSIHYLLQRRCTNTHFAQWIMIDFDFDFDTGIVSELASERKPLNTGCFVLSLGFTLL